MAPDKTNPLTDLLQQAQPSTPPADSLEESTTGFNPHLMGDFGTIYARQYVTVTGYQTITTTTSTLGFSSTSSNYTINQTTTTKTVPVTMTRLVLVPVSSLGAFNVGENESPRPQDRVFFFYNFYDDLRGPDIGSNVPIVRTTSNTTMGVDSIGNPTTTTVQTSTVTPGVRPRVSLDREVFGFEKTFLDGNASVEFRLPLLQQQGGGFNDYSVGDVTLVGKYAFINNRVTGDVLSAGLALTLPNGEGLATTEGSFNSVLVQPFFGYIYNFDLFYIQGIHSLVIPTNSQEPTLLFNDVGLNFWAHRGSPNSFLSFVVPTFEVHVTTALTHGGSCDPLFAPDEVILTSGAHFGLYRNAVLTLGVAAPVTGPTPFSIEAFVQYNWRF